MVEARIFPRFNRLADAVLLIIIGEAVAVELIPVLRIDARLNGASLVVELAVPEVNRQLDMSLWTVHHSHDRMVSNGIPRRKSKACRKQKSET
jgi:hypothetical protein